MILLRSSMGRRGWDFGAAMVAGQRPRASVVAVALLATACNGNQRDPNVPNAALERRDTEMEHEDCDIRDGKGLDANGDGRPDIIQVFSGSRETCRAVDINMDTVIDRYVYFDGAGNKRRVESGFDRDMRPDEIAYFQGGQLVRKERETNNDQHIDTWSYFEGGRLVREERDSTGDGYIDQWWRFDRPDRPECALVVTDGDGDGKPDEDSQIDTCASDDTNTFAPKPKPKPEEKDASDAGSSEGADEGDGAGPDGEPESPAPSGEADEGGEQTP